MSTDAPLLTSQARRVAYLARLYVLGMLLALAVIVGRVVQLKLAPDDRLVASSNPTVSSQAELGRRGNLLDRRGRILATSSVGYRVFIDPMVVDDPHTIAVDLAAVLNDDPARIDQEISKRPDSRYIVVNHLLDDWQVDAVQNAKLRGVGLEPRLVRHYPHGDLATSIVGTVGFEHSGLGGFEHAFDTTLAPSRGSLEFVRDTKRRALWIDPEQYTPAQDGRDIRFSIDLVVQEFAEQRLQTCVDEHNAGGGRLIVIDCTTGEILAMCDTLREREGWDEFTSDEMRKTHPSLGRNRCVTDPYEPGSTFKPFFWAVATELGYATPDEMLDCPDHTGHRTSQGRLIRDSHYYGRVDWQTVLVKSMNSGMAIVAERMSHEELQESVSEFGFGRRTFCGIPGETIGLVTPRQKWTHYTQTSVPMGHEIGVTAVQMIRAFSVFARDGTMPALRITATTPDSEQFRAVHRIVSEETVRTTRAALRDVMMRGTGRRAQSELYQLFGKSGTPQLPKREGGGYHEDRYMPSFIAGAPFNDPQIVVLCIIDDPDKTIAHYGGAVAGPVVRDVIDHTLQYLGVPSDQPTDDPI
ncbi:MAG: penicillin-binding protein 2 [Planctomycetota bacterium]